MERSPFPLEINLTLTLLRVSPLNNSVGRAITTHSILIRGIGDQVIHICIINDTSATDKVEALGADYRLGACSAADCATGPIAVSPR